MTPPHTTDGKPLLDQQQLADAARQYGLRIESYGPVEVGYRNVSHAFCSRGQWYNLIIFRRGTTKSQIETQHAVSKALAQGGLPMRVPADPRILELRSGNWVRLAGLYAYLPGKTIPWEAYTQKHIKLLGWVMADMHRAGRDTPGFGAPTVAAICKRDSAKMERYFSDTGVQLAIATKLGFSVNTERLAMFGGFFSELATLPDQQPLHMDFVRGNVLFDSPSSSSSDTWKIGDICLSGILDIEKVSIGHPLLDLARTLAFLIADCQQKSEAQIRRYFLDSGYIKRGASPLKPLFITPPSGQAYDVLETAMTYFWLYDLFKLLRSNPYEALYDNYHFVRTRDILRARNLLHYI